LYISFDCTGGYRKILLVGMFIKPKDDFELEEGASMELLRYFIIQ